MGKANGMASVAAERGGNGLAPRLKIRRFLKRARQLSASGRVPNIAPIAAYVLLIMLAACAPDMAFASEATAQGEIDGMIPAACFAVAAAAGSTIFLVLGCKHRATFQRRRRRWRHR